METDNRITALAVDLKRLRGDRDDLNTQVKELTAQIQTIESQLAEAMLNDEIQNFNLAGTTFYLSTKVHATPVAEMKHELFNALREHGFASLVVETINSQTLASFIKEQRDENAFALPDWLDGLVSVFDQTGVNMRRASR
jgi:hypothetical protein